MSIFLIKLIAAASMLLDHIGMILFPNVLWLRIAGRLAFPLYALCIAEGFRHTRNRITYFLRIFVLGAVCQVVYFFVSADPYLGILITFSLSIVLLFLLDALLCACQKQKNPICSLWERLFKKAMPRPAAVAVCALLFCAALSGIFMLNRAITIDYGMTGVLFPVLVYLGYSSHRQKLLGPYLGIAMLSCNFEGAPTPRIWSLLALIPITLYNGKPGKYKLKYFFYIFYPAHLVVLYAIDVLLAMLGR